MWLVTLGVVTTFILSISRRHGRTPHSRMTFALLPAFLAVSFPWTHDNLMSYGRVAVVAAGVAATNSVIRLC